MEERARYIENGMRRNLFNGESSAHRKACIRNESSKKGGGRDIIPYLNGEQNLNGFLVNLVPGSFNKGTSSRTCNLKTQVLSSPMVGL